MTKIKKVDTIKANIFLDIAKENGRIRDIKEAFEDYPVKEEWHKGKIENVLKEGGKK